MGVGVNDQSGDIYKNHTVVSLKDRDLINQNYLLGNQLKMKDGKYENRGIAFYMKRIRESKGAERESLKKGLAAIFGVPHQYGVQKLKNLKDADSWDSFDGVVASNARIGGLDQSFEFMKRRFDEVVGYRDGKVARQLYIDPQTSVLDNNSENNTFTEGFSIRRTEDYGPLLFGNRAGKIGGDDTPIYGMKDEDYIRIGKNANGAFVKTVGTKDGEYNVSNQWTASPVKPGSREDGEPYKVQSINFQSKVEGGLTLAKMKNREGGEFKKKEALVQINNRNSSVTSKARGNVKVNTVRYKRLGDQGLLLDYIAYKKGWSDEVGTTHIPKVTNPEQEEADKKRNESQTRAKIVQSDRKYFHRKQSGVRVYPYQVWDDKKGKYVQKFLKGNKNVPAVMSRDELNKLYNLQAKASKGANNYAGMT